MRRTFIEHVAAAFKIFKGEDGCLTAVVHYDEFRAVKTTTSSLMQHCRSGMFSRSVFLANRSDKDLKSISLRVLNGDISSIWPPLTKDEPHVSDSENRSQQQPQQQLQQLQQLQQQFLQQQWMHGVNHRLKQTEQQHDRQQQQSMAIPRLAAAFQIDQNEVSAQLLFALRKEIEQLRC